MVSGERILRTLRDWGGGAIDNNGSKVAVDRTSPNGRVVGIDVIPARPPSGVSTIQGNFLSNSVQEEVKRFLHGTQNKAHYHETPIGLDRQYRTDDNHGMTARSYLELEKQSRILAPGIAHDSQGCQEEGEKGRSGRESYIVDVVLSDMSAPWEQTEGFWKRSLSDPYYRMMNTSGINFRDHAGSMVSNIVPAHASERLQMTLRTGPLRSSSEIRLRYAKAWWPFRVQVLPGLRGSGA